MLRRTRYLIKINILMIKEMFNMVFTENSQMVKSVLLLITAGMITEEDVPNLGNLREVVAEILTK